MDKLTLLDWKLLFQLDLNSRTGYSELAKKLKTSKEVVAYRVNRLIEHGYISQFYTIINPYKFGFVAYKLYLNFQNMNQKVGGEIIRFLKDHKMVFWVASTNGTFEMMIGLWARDHYDFNNNFLIEFMNRFSPYISEKETSISLDNRQINRKWFIKSSSERKVTNSGGKPENIELEDVDKKIIHILANDSRKSYTEIAEQTKSTLQIVKYRIAKMEKQGIIMHYKLGVDPKRYGKEFVKTFFFLKNINEDKLKQFIANCLELKPTLNVLRCIGQWELEVEMEVDSLEEYHTIINQVRERFPDIIKSYKTAVIIEEHKLTFSPQMEEKQSKRESR